MGCFQFWFACIVCQLSILLPFKGCDESLFCNIASLEQNEAYGSCVLIRGKKREIDRKVEDVLLYLSSS